MKSIEDKLTSCCKLLRSMFNYGNIGDILKIMKFSLGLQIPKTLEAIYDMEADDYSMLFPNNGNFTGLEKLG